MVVVIDYAFTAKVKTKLPPYTLSPDGSCVGSPSIKFVRYLMAGVPVPTSVAVYVPDASGAVGANLYRVPLTDVTVPATGPVGDDSKKVVPATVPPSGVLLK